MAFIIIKRPQLITSIAECILTCLKFHVVCAMLDATESTSMRCGLQRVALLCGAQEREPCGGIMEGDGSLHILLFELQSSLHMAVKSRTVLSVPVEEGRQLGTLPEPHLQYRNWSQLQYRNFSLRP